MKHILFNEYELKNNVQFSIVRKNETDDSEKKASLCSIFTVNFENIYYDIDSNIYFMYIPYNDLKLVSRNQLNDMFENGYLSYMKESPKIPGIVGGAVKR